MPIDPAVAIGAELPARTFAWRETDVLLYHLALGARPDELSYVYERDLTVLPTFAVVIPTLGQTKPPTVRMPGVDVDLLSALHGRQELVMHRPLPPSGQVEATGRVADVQDKGSSAVIVVEAATPYFTTRTSIFARGEGGFGGHRGASTRVEVPDRAPDFHTVVRTTPEQPLLYRLCGDLNPLHVDPGFAAMAGFDRPILHGLCTYGLVAKALIDGPLEGDVARVGSYAARFSGVVFPGESLRVCAWHSDGAWVVTATVVERDDAPALSDATLTTV
ncbi:MAG: 3-alpha,7-alpha,12-alpha-trihydroxy-5-beta-cholest-24-enoyl-CoA hydratase [Hamadaea sp.]|nr:3-alpha,7-alpha,12-alpha-trihydroxy-5-beta-cholest-24-enoyl-CoA hydratase [Hamadaea sp.]